MTTHRTPTREPASPIRRRPTAATIARVPSGSSEAHPATQLQRSLGNHAVQRLLQASGVQTQLKVSKPGDQSEREAERVADGMTRAAPPRPTTSGVVQRQAASSSDDHVDRAASGTSSTPSAAAHAIATKGSGEPINPATRGKLESHLGTDLGGVRVHSDGAANKAADALNARAFTHQKDIWLGRGESQADTRLMAHEATHVVQQTGTVQRQAKKGVKPPDSAESPKGAAQKRSDKTGIIDPKTPDTITFDQIEIPSFKADVKHRRSLYDKTKLIRRKNYKRGSPNQRDVWKKDIDGTTIKKVLTERTTATKGGKGGNQHVFEVPTGKPGGGGKPFFIGTVDEITEALKTPYWGKGDSKTAKVKTFDVDHIVELQLSDWGGQDTTANTLPNMELLESKANRSSGSMIASKIDEKVDAYIKVESAAPQPESDTEPKSSKKKTKKPALTADKVKAKYNLAFTTVKGKGGHTVNDDDFWTSGQIQAGCHLEPVKAARLEDIQSKGTVLIFPNERGGLGKGFSWKETDTGKHPVDPKSKEADWMKPFTITQKHFFTQGEGIEKNAQLGELEIQIRHNTKWKDYGPKLIKVPRIIGARTAGYLIKHEVRSDAEKITQKHHSPIHIDDFDISNDDGLYASGQIISDIPLIRGAELDFELRGDTLKVSKTFATGDFKVPKPLTVTDSSLTISLATDGEFEISGQANFEVDKVGTGHLGVGASSKSGFSLAGQFDFDSALFDPAQLSMSYDREKGIGIEGKLGIKAKTVRGVKAADLTVRYQQNTFSATGHVEPSIPGIEQGDLSLTYSEAEGIVIAGSLELKKDLPGIAGGSIQAEVTKKPGSDRYVVKASGEATTKIPGINSKLAVTYDDGAFDAVAHASYAKGMLKGAVTVGATNRPVDKDGKTAPPPAESSKSAPLTLYGGGMVSLRLTPWLEGTAAITFRKDGGVQVKGEIGLPATLNIFEEKKLDKNLFKIGIDIPVVGVSVLGKRIGIFLNIGGGLDLSAGIGPGQLQGVKLAVVYDPDHEENTAVKGHAGLHIPAYAGLRLFVRGSLGAGIPIVSAQAGIEVGGRLGIAGAAQAAVDVDWTPKKGLVLEAKAEISAQPSFKFDVTGFVLVEADLLLKTITLYEKKWQLAAVEYGSGMTLGLKLPIHYEEGKPFNVSLSDIQFDVPKIDATDILKGLVKKIA